VWITGRGCGWITGRGCGWITGRGSGSISGAYARGVSLLVPGKPTARSRRRTTVPQRESQMPDPSGAAWSSIGTMISGLWGGVGALVDAFVVHRGHVGLAVGILVGMAGSLYLTWVKLVGASPRSTTADLPAPPAVPAHDVAGRAGVRGVTPPS